MTRQKLPSTENDLDTNDSLNDDRRKFLAACGKFAVITPPALTVLLSTSLNSEAIANSGGGYDGPGRGGNGWHGHDHDGHGWGHDRDWWEWLERLLDRLF